MLEFLSVLFNTFQQANVHTAIFINGALEPDRSGQGPSLSFCFPKKIYELLTCNRTTGLIGSIVELVQDILNTLIVDTSV
jgi:hypothetical protein